MTDAGPTPRQVLYALVAAGFVVVVAVLTVGAAVAGLVPSWWSLTLGAVILLASTWIGLNWQRTAGALSVAIGLFVMWLVGTVALVV